MTSRSPRSAELAETGARLLQAPSRDELDAVLADWLRTKGFDNLVISHRGTTGVPVIEYALAPEGWGAYYFEEALHRIDPVYAAALSRMTPHTWADLVTPRTSLDAVRFMDEARAAGLRDGFTIVLGDGLGSRKIYTISSRDGADTEPVAAAAFMLASTHMAAARIIRRHSARRLRLTAREREILRWVAIGKTASEIGDLLSISTKTVNNHVTNAKTRNKLHNTRLLIATALVEGQIDLPDHLVEPITFGAFN